MRETCIRFAAVLGLAAGMAPLSGCAIDIGSSTKRDTGGRLDRLESRMAAAEERLQIAAPDAAKGGMR